MFNYKPTKGRGRKGLVKWPILFLQELSLNIPKDFLPPIKILPENADCKESSSDTGKEKQTVKYFCCNKSPGTCKPVGHGEEKGWMKTGAAYFNRMIKKSCVRTQQVPDISI